MDLIMWMLAFAAIVGIIAASKGRNAFGWAIYGALLFPIALTHVIVTPSAAVRDARQNPRFPCPKCAEPILAAATVCPHCRSDLPAGWATPAPRHSDDLVV